MHEIRSRSVSVTFVRFVVNAGYLRASVVDPLVQAPRGAQPNSSRISHTAISMAERSAVSPAAMACRVFLMLTAPK